MAAERLTVGLVGCVKTKLPHAAAARDLYASPLFRRRRAAVEALTDQWFVLSAEYGLVKPDELIQPYDLALADLSVARRREWSRKVVAELCRQLGDLGNFRFEIHAGRHYFGYGLEDALKAEGAPVSIPTRRLSQGQQLHYYATQQLASAGSARERIGHQEDDT